MLTRKELLDLARARLRDAEALFDAKRYEGAMYLCGYVVELALKARICKTLNWPGYPATKSEFEGYASFKTHTLGLLLRLSGQETKIKTRFLAEWSDVNNWNPESRYIPIRRIPRGSRAREMAALQKKAKDMIDSARVLLRQL